MTTGRVTSQQPESAFIWGEGVRALRRLRGEMTQQQLAELAGTTQGTISVLESGSRRIGDGLRVRIARALDVDVYELFPYEEESA